MECSAHGHDEQWLDEGGENEEDVKRRRTFGGKVGIPFDMTQGRLLYQFLLKISRSRP